MVIKGYPVKKGWYKEAERSPWKPI